MAAAKKTAPKKSSAKKAAPRPLDIVVFGATGFTGRLAAERLAQRALDEDFSFAIAGRNLEKLKETRDALVAINPDCAKAVPMIEADVSDPASLEAMAAQAKVVLTTVGPYARYGMPVVDACVAQGTDYVDITGEGDFVMDVIARHGEEARDKKLRIVSCCGFDSIPADLGAYLTRKALPEDEPATIEAYVSFSSEGTLNPFASVSGGTWHSAIGFMKPQELLRRGRSLEAIGKAAGPGRSVEAMPLVATPPRDGHRWGAPLPLIDVEVVLRSAAEMEDYGPKFRYGHFAEVGSLVTLGAGAAAMGGVAMLAQFPPARALLLKLREPGEGPDAEQRARNHFKVSFFGRAGKTRAVGTVEGGDPGYGDTSKMVSAAALSLAKDRRRLPRRYGVLTPAAAMGDVLVERLRDAGLVLEAQPV